MVNMSSFSDHKIVHLSCLQECDQIIEFLMGQRTRKGGHVMAAVHDTYCQEFRGELIADPRQDGTAIPPIAVNIVAVFASLLMKQL